MIYYVNVTMAILWLSFQEAATLTPSEATTDYGFRVEWLNVADDTDCYSMSMSESEVGKVNRFSNTRISSVFDVLIISPPVLLLSINLFSLIIGCALIVFNLW